MIGAGVFAAWSPAADAAGLIIGLVIAGVVAFCTQSAQLAALYPKSGGTYIYGQVSSTSCAIVLAMLSRRSRCAASWVCRWCQDCQMVNVGSGTGMSIFVMGSVRAIDRTRALGRLPT